MRNLLIIAALFVMHTAGAQNSETLYSVGQNEETRQIEFYHGDGVVLHTEVNATIQIIHYSDFSGMVVIETTTEGVETIIATSWRNGISLPNESLFYSPEEGKLVRGRSLGDTNQAFKDVPKIFHEAYFASIEWYSLVGQDESWKIGDVEVSWFTEDEKTYLSFSKGRASTTVGID